MRVFATILDNPGDPPAETRYRDPLVLRQLGYTDLVIYPTTGLSGLFQPDTIASGDNRRWVGELFDSVEQTVDRARAAGMDVWLTYDAPSLARELVGSAMHCVRNPLHLCPGSPELLDMIGQCVESLLGRFRDVQGLVLRLGDNDAHRTPYLLGNDLYAPHCARCNELGRRDRLVRFIRFFRELVIDKLDRQLIVRAWNLRPGGLHDDPELAQRVMAELPDDQRLVMSFKFTQSDFWRYQKWNPSSLQCGNRPIIYELECQREFEGKGAMPNYQPPLWRDGMPEVGEAFGLMQAADRVNLFGLWAWVRGGGYGGPYVSVLSETWIDANVVAVPRLAADPRINLDVLASDWIQSRFGCTDPSAIGALHRVLAHSTQNVLESFYIGPYAAARTEPWYPSGSFIQDDLVDAQAGWAIIQRLHDRSLDEVMHEKLRAVERVAQDRRAIQQSIREIGPQHGELLVHQMEYTESLIESLGHLLAAMVHYRRYRRKPDPALARSLVDAVHHCQSYWNHHQRYANFRGTATAFRSDNLWDFTQHLLDQVAT